nr:unnamed protein product [Digitaria exilis]
MNARHRSERELDSRWDRIGSNSNVSESVGVGAARDEIFDLRERLERLREPDSLADLRIRSIAPRGSSFQMVVVEGWFRSPLRLDLGCSCSATARAVEGGQPRAGHPSPS